MKKVGLLIGPLNDVGGLSVSIRRHIKFLSSHFHIIPISISTTPNQELWAGSITEMNFDDHSGYHLEVGQVEENGLQDKCLSDLLHKVIKKDSLELLHIYGAYKNRAFVGMMASLRSNIPYLLSFRGIDLDTRIYDSQVLSQLGYIVKNASAITVLHQEAKHVLESIFEVKDNVFLIKNAFNKSDFSPIVRKAEKKSTFNIATFGEFRRVQGIDDVLKTANKLNELGIDFKLHLYGKFRKKEESFYNDLMKKYSHLNIECQSLPHSEVLNAMANMDILLFPSITDACPNKILEAMASETPFITTSVPGIVELVGEDYPYLVDPRDSDAIVKIIQQGFTNWCPISNKLENFTEEKIFSKWTDLYKKL
jgi:glycosyltransferase involved in cell wall biosynthesis